MTQYRASANVCIQARSVGCSTESNSCLCFLTQNKLARLHNFECIVWTICCSILLNSSAKMAACEANCAFKALCLKLPPGKFKDMYTLGDEIGWGATATVVKAKEIASGDTVAVKVIKKETLLTAEHVTNLTNEISALAALSHDGILKMHQAIHDADNVYIVTEYYPMGSLRGFGVDNDFEGPEIQTLNYLRQMLEALTYMHEKGYAHLDVKTMNVMITEQGKVKLVDFGFAEKLPSVSEPICQGFIGTLTFKAPEIDARLPFAAEKADVFSAGASLYEMLAGREKAPVRPFERIERVSEETNALLNLLTHKDPKQRPTAEEATKKVHWVMLKLIARQYAPPKEILLLVFPFLYYLLS